MPLASSVTLKDFPDLLEIPCVRQHQCHWAQEVLKTVPDTVRVWLVCDEGEMSGRPSSFPGTWPVCQWGMGPGIPGSPKL